MKCFAASAIFGAMSICAPAQWLDYPTPGIPRTPDGKPNLSAPAPRNGGKPDISGTWQTSGIGASINMTGDLKFEEMKPWAQAFSKTYLATYGANDTDIRCLPPGPRAGLFSLNLLKIIQTSAQTTILYEEGPYRQIFTDGRPLPKDPNPSWMGYSIGRWEGDTFTVESSGFNDRTILDYTGHPHSEALKIIEKFRRKDFGHMRLDITYEDPKTYNRPWTVGVDLNFVPDTELLEFVCNENERDDKHLVGKQQDDRKQEIKLAKGALTKFTGKYDMPEIGIVVVSVRGDALALEMPGGGGPQPMFAVSEMTFNYPALGATIEFGKDSKGSIDSMTMKIVEGDMKANRHKN
jgi:hypothetical protein